MVAPKVPTPGSTTCFARADGIGVASARSVLRPEFLEGGFDRGEVRRAGRQDQHISHDQRTPLVLGTSLEPSRATAWRRANAAALKAASARW